MPGRHYYVFSLKVSNSKGAVQSLRDNKYYKRLPNSSVPMDHYEIVERMDSLGSQSIKYKEQYESRLEQLQKGSTIQPVSYQEKCIIFCHPLFNTQLTPSIISEIKQIQPSFLKPVGTSMWDGNINDTGILLFNQKEPDLLLFAQLYRNGSIEWVCKSPVENTRDRQRTVDLAKCTKYIYETLCQSVALYRFLNIDSPFETNLILTSITNTRGSCGFDGYERYGPSVYNRDVLVVKSDPYRLFIDNELDHLDMILKKQLDRIWQSWGYSSLDANYSQEIHDQLLRDIK